jgi:hypothetical protein
LANPDFNDLKAETKKIRPEKIITGSAKRDEKK